VQADSVIEVKNLKKYYKSYKKDKGVLGSLKSLINREYKTIKAVDNITFNVAKGEIKGLIGPNGAGKSTTMKIATGFIRPSNGTITLEGVDVIKNPLEVKRMTGYLPEHNPLYLEMYVKEYLRFVGVAYKLKKIRYKVAGVIKLTGLEREEGKKIGALSKGYRQRVGLAQALIHDPEVLILDEPASGLDPNQLLEIRKVIKQASENKTVLLSTHIMQEVDALCDKVVIINKGKIVADEKIENIKRMQSGKFSYKVEFEEAVDIRLFKDFEIEYQEDGVYVISSGMKDLRKQIMKIVGDRELPLVNISKKELSLEGVFQELTKDT